MKKDNAQLIHQDSGRSEYFTPIEIVEAARELMGTIDLDPASSVLVNRRIKASYIYTKEDDGLSHDWFGNVWLNHPFSRKNNPLWIAKLVEEHLAVDMQICCITFAATSEKWFQPLLKYPQCFLSPRTNYYLPDGSLKKGVTKGSVVTYLGDDVLRFTEVFNNFGVVKI